MVRLSQYVFRRLEEWGVEHTFLLTGGGAMFLNDSLATSRIRPICHHHEQACAMAAEGYARVTGKTGVVNVTTGPGGINALNGVFGAFTDSIPLLILSGQVKRETSMVARGITGLRQLGDQEVDIISMVQPITKYARMVTDPATIRYHLERAWFLAAKGRPGPCWLDIPTDVQAAMIDEDSLAGYDPAEDKLAFEDVAAQVKQTLDRIRRSERPVILAGSGIRIAGAVDVFRRVFEKLGVPVTTAWTHDLIESDHPLFAGRPGSIGTRAGNFTVQNADTLLILGSRLNIRQTSFNWENFAREAHRIQVDIDPAEMNKPTTQAHEKIHCDVRLFLEEMERQIDAGAPRANFAEWAAWCRERVRRYPATAGKQSPAGLLNPYLFIADLFRNLADDDVVICGNATACIVPYQVAELKRGQRLISNSGSASMGHDLPAAIGAAVARGGKRVICLAGDGSLQLNIQELQTLAHHKLPVKIFVLNNNGYLSIRGTQESFFGNMIGESPASGVSFPDYVKVAQAYGLEASRIQAANVAEGLSAVLASDGPHVCDVILDPAQRFEPRLSSKRLPDGRMVTAPLEDMFPFLEREEFEQNMLIPVKAGA